MNHLFDSDIESDTEVPYADIMITIRGVSTPELTQVSYLATGEVRVSVKVHAALWWHISLPYFFLKAKVDIIFLNEICHLWDFSLLAHILLLVLAK